MTALVSLGYLEWNSVRIAEISGWTDATEGSPQDISIIGNVDADGNPVARTRPGTPSVTLNVNFFHEFSDPAQSQVVQGAEGGTMVLYPGGNKPLHEKRTYSDCSVNSRNLDGSNYQGLVTGTATISANGGVKSEVIP